MQINHPERLPLSAVSLPLKSGAAGIRQTTQLMADIVAEYEADPNIRAQAISIVQLNQPKDEPAEMRALFDFVQRSIRYVGDVYNRETVQTPDKTLALRAGDCDDKSVLLATLMRAIGYDAVFIVTGYTLPGTYEHVYVGWPTGDGDMIGLDATEPMPMGWEAPGAVARYVQTIPKAGQPSLMHALAWWISPI